MAKIDPNSNRRVAKDFAGRSPAGAAFGEGSLWVANHGENTVDRFDPRSFGRGPVAWGAEIGLGGFGRVMEARYADDCDPRNTGQLLAVKFLRDDLIEDLRALAASGVQLNAAAKERVDADPAQTAGH